MKPAPFDLHRPRSVVDAVALLAEHGDEAKVLAGGQSLVPLLALRLVTPGHLVDLSRVDELTGIEATDGTVRIGAMTTHHAVGRHDLVTGRVPLVARAVPLVGHAAIRHRGTFGGSVAHADPASEYPAVCLALGATMELQGPAGARHVPADEFFVSTFTTALQADEVLAAVHLPAATPRSGCAIDEVARRKGDFALAGAACSVRLDDAGRVGGCGVALFGVADRPWRASVAEDALTGRTVHELDAAALEEVAALGVADLEPPESVHASSPYLNHIARVLVARVLDRALKEAAGE